MLVTRLVWNARTTAFGIKESDLSKAASVTQQVSSSRIRGFLSEVVGPRNRFTSQEKMIQVENYLCEAFTKFGWTVERQKYHCETFQGWSSIITPTKGFYTNLDGVNIVASKLGKHPDQIVLIGAHYDTVDNSPSADDNGSGIAALLELARVLGKHNFSKTVILVAFDMEEIGLAGSRAFLEKLPPKTMVDAAIIFETIAYVNEKENSQKIPPGFSLLYGQQIEKVKRRQSRGDFITVIHNGRSKKLTSLFAGANQSLKETTQLVFIRDPLDLPISGLILKRVFPRLKNPLRSDHAPLWKAGIPAIQLTDTTNSRNPHYHMPTDTIDTLDFSVLAGVAQVTAATVTALAQMLG